MGTAHPTWVLPNHAQVAHSWARTRQDGGVTPTRSPAWRELWRDELPWLNTAWMFIRGHVACYGRKPQARVGHVSCRSVQCDVSTPH